MLAAPRRACCAHGTAATACGDSPTIYLHLMPRSLHLSAVSTDMCACVYWSAMQHMSICVSSVGRQENTATRRGGERPPSNKTSAQMGAACSMYTTVLAEGGLQVKGRNSSSGL